MLPTFCCLRDMFSWNLCGIRVTQFPEDAFCITVWASSIVPWRHSCLSISMMQSHTLVAEELFWQQVSSSHLVHPAECTGWWLWCFCVPANHWSLILCTGKFKIEIPLTLSYSSLKFCMKSNATNFEKRKLCCKVAFVHFPTSGNTSYSMQSFSWCQITFITCPTWFIQIGRIFLSARGN